MKKVLFISLLLFIASCKSKKTVSDTKDSKAIRTVTASEVESFKKNRAFELGNRLLETCNTSKFRAFSKDEATENVINNATPERIAATCKKINMRNGKYLGLELIDITYNPELEEYLFRYMISYQKKLYKRELYVTLNNEDKVSAISTKEVNVDGTNLRLDIKRHKSAAGYTDAIGLALGIIGTDTEFDPNTYKPVITVEPFGNLVNIRFTKNGVNGINIYTRKKGDTNFKLLSRATKSPFKYQPAIDDSGKPIQWEFIAFGVIRDEEIGLPSDSVTFVFSQQTEA